jgi:hypothetical protein
VNNTKGIAHQAFSRKDKMYLIECATKAICLTVPVNTGLFEKLMAFIILEIVI